MPHLAYQRAALVFTLFDANDNGVLDAEDFDLMTERVLAVADDSSQADRQALSDSISNYWEVMAKTLDVNGDGLVTPTEFRGFVLNPDLFGATAAVFADALAKLGDPDGDGLIERPRFLALMTAIGFEKPNIEALFNAFGPDASDRITVEVWAQGIRDYYSPEKVGIAGDRLVANPV
ncbi:EF-hand domain-containing protein [Kitasatospora cheerisanensis]|uniref:Calcium-binding protein n=1 Tax=Kitasatospora cheerisanensis KCTC 2395 TaxID=1348663 RepID=A0A066YVP3_9ACTN|nr:EF-hand domain-containing protein [Kitasatospora cheerisanensis]KDN82151.1 calcium-binding protein [Kitasatospora cheerisanensis KCTC 2395]